MNRSDVSRPDNAPEFSTEPRRARRAGRHTHGRPEHTYWSYGASLMFVTAALGMLVVILSVVAPDLARSPALRVLAFACIGLSVLCVLMIFYGARRGSRRFRNKQVWLALTLAALVVTSLAVQEYRLGRKAVEKPVNDAGSDPIGDRI